eukprot:364857-Chlamydomonas_euryale.AAC.9
MPSRGMSTRWHTWWCVLEYLFLILRRVMSHATCESSYTGEQNQHAFTPSPALNCCDHKIT